MDKLIEFLTKKIEYTLSIIVFGGLVGVAFIFVWDYELFITIDVFKLILLAFSISGVLGLPNVCFGCCMALLYTNKRGKTLEGEVIFTATIIINTVLLLLSIIGKILFQELTIEEVINMYIIGIFVVSIFGLICYFINRLCKKRGKNRMWEKHKGELLGAILAPIGIVLILLLIVWIFEQFKLHVPGSREMWMGIFWYIVALAAQLSGGLILLLNNILLSPKRLGEEYCAGNVIIEWDNEKEEIIVEPSRLEGLLCNVYLNKMAFIYLVFGYGISVFGNMENSHALVTLLIIIALSAITCMVSYKACTYFARKNSEKEKYQKMIRDNLPRKVNVS